MFNNFTMAKPILYTNNTNVVWGKNSLYNERVPRGILDISNYVFYLRNQDPFMKPDKYKNVFFTCLKDLQLTLYKKDEIEAARIVEEERIEAARIVEAARIAATRIEVASSFLNPVATPFIPTYATTRS